MPSPTLAGYQGTNITTAATKSDADARFLSHIVINGGTLTGDIDVYDGPTVADGTLKATIAGGSGQVQGHTYPYRINLAGGFTIVTDEAVDITVTHKNK